MTDTLVTVKMLQGLAGEHIALSPGDLIDVPAAQAKLWAEHGIAEAAAQPRTGTVQPPRTTRAEPHRVGPPRSV
jgi:hypothetical protein